MHLEVAFGTGLVLATWAVLTGLVLALGLLPAALTTGAPRSMDGRWSPILRSALWWGLLALVGAVLTLAALRVGLASPAAAWSVGGLVLALGGAGWWVLRRRFNPKDRRPAQEARAGGSRPSWVTLGLLAALGLATVYLALKALGPLTHYDAGLYHLSAIAYAADFGSIPGLANLHRPLGYANALFPLGALFGNGPWDGIGYRLLNGFVLVLAMLELGLRLGPGGSRRRSWGTWVLLIGLGATLPALIAMADFWVTSPNPDTTMLALTLVACAYLADYVGSRRNRSLNGSVVLALIIVMLAIRPTAAFFAITALAVVIVVQVRRHSGLTRGAWVVSTVVALVVGALVVARDAVLSGWIGYPLSLLHLNVPWLAEDPTALRDSTLAAARNPYTTDSWHTAHSWDWIGAWIARLPSQWEPYLLLALIVIAAITWFVARRTLAGHRIRPTMRQLLVVMVPSVVAIIAWFTISPPSFRFAWGPIFSAPVIVISAMLARIDRAQRNTSTPMVHRLPDIVIAVAAIGIIGVTVFSLGFRSQVDAITEPQTWRLGPVAIDYAIAPLPAVPTHEVTLGSGLVIRAPDTGEQCWDIHPLCTPLVGDIEQRGASIADGFARRGQ